MNKLDKSIFYSFLIILCFLSACKADEVPVKYLEVDVPYDYVVKIPNYGEYNFVEEDGKEFHGRVYYDSVADLKLLISGGPLNERYSDTARISDIELVYYLQSEDCNYFRKGRRFKMQYNLGSIEEHSSAYFIYEIDERNTILTKRFSYIIDNYRVSLYYNFGKPTDKLDLLSDWERANQFHSIEIVKKGDIKN